MLDISSTAVIKTFVKRHSKANIKNKVQANQQVAIEKDPCSMVGMMLYRTNFRVVLATLHGVRYAEFDPRNL